MNQDKARKERADAVSKREAFDREDRLAYERKARE